MHNCGIAKNILAPRPDGMHTQILAPKNGTARKPLIESKYRYNMYLVFSPDYSFRLSPGRRCRLCVMCEIGWLSTDVVRRGVGKAELLHDFSWNQSGWTVWAMTRDIFVIPLWTCYRRCGRGCAWAWNFGGKGEADSCIGCWIQPRSFCRIKVGEQWKDEAGRGSVGAAPLVAPRLHVRWSVSLNG